MREKLIEIGVKGLKEFGYPAVNKDNIVTDAIYGQFFKSILEDALEERQIKRSIRKLIPHRVMGWVRRTTMRANEKSFTPPPMNPDTRDRLKRVVLPEVEKLQDLLGSDLLRRWGYDFDAGDASVE